MLAVAKLSGSAYCAVFIFILITSNVYLLLKITDYSQVKKFGSENRSFLWISTVSLNQVTHSKAETIETLKEFGSIIRKLPFKNYWIIGQESVEDIPNSLITELDSSVPIVKCPVVQGIDYRQKRINCWELLLNWIDSQYKDGSLAIEAVDKVQVIFLENLEGINVVRQLASGSTDYHQHTLFQSPNAVTVHLKDILKDKYSVHSKLSEHTRMHPVEHNLESN